MKEVSILLVLMFAICASQGVRAQKKFKSEDGLYGLAISDEVVVPARFTELNSFIQGYAWVKTRDSIGYINSDLEIDLVANEMELPTFSVPSSLQFTLELDASSLSYFFEKHLEKGNSQITTSSLVSYFLSCLKNAGIIYADYPQQYPMVLTGEGLLVGRYTYNLTESAEDENKIKAFVLGVIESKTRRNQAMNLLIPLVQFTFKNMPAYHKMHYKTIGQHLVAYLADYDMDAVKMHLEANPSTFAYVAPDQSTSPYRKLTAFADRLILVHDVISAKELEQIVKQIMDNVFEEQ